MDKIVSTSLGPQEKNVEMKLTIIPSRVFDHLQTTSVHVSWLDKHSRERTRRSRSHRLERKGDSGRVWGTVA